MAEFLKVWDTKKHLARFRRAFDLHSLFSGLLGCFEHYRQTSCTAALTSNGPLFEIPPVLEIWVSIQCKLH